MADRITFCPGDTIAIVGSRKFPRPDLVRKAVARLPNGVTVVSGGAEGVDTWAREAAVERGLAVTEFRPQWKADGVYDPAAGFRRNALIVNAASVLIAFWYNRSAGTANSLKHARRKGIPVAVCAVTPHGQIEWSVHHAIR